MIVVIRHASWIVLGLIGLSGCAALGIGRRSAPSEAPAAAVADSGSAPATRVIPDTARAAPDTALAGADVSPFAPGDTAAAFQIPDSTGATLPRPGVRESLGLTRRGNGPRRVDYLWVLRSTLTRPASIDSVVARASQIGVRGLLVQVVGRGDAYYRSDLLPRAEALWNSEADYDPLGEVVTRAHRAGLEVHAWVNCMLVWSAPHPPRDPRHVVRAHPEWVARLRDGRRMSQLKPRDFRRLGVEGVFLAPGHPGVRRWLASVVGEIAERYPVDGVHLDYIRQPGAPVGYDPTTRARFALESGVDPQRLDRVPSSRRAAVESAWKAFQQEQVTALVREVRDSLEVTKPGTTLSAAVIADTVTAERANAQAWRSWVRQGLVDRVFPMCYAASVQKVMDQLAAMAREFGASDRLVPGIAVFNTPLATAAVKMRGARELGFPLLALYSYDSLYSRSPGWSSLRDLIGSSTESP